MVVENAVPEELLRLEQAVELFAAAGLELPAVEVVFRSDRADCKDHYGLFESNPTPARITVCSHLPWVIPHELAHAWVEVSLDDLAREEYRISRKLPTWNSREFSWNERATEDAAFVLQQVLMGQAGLLISDGWERHLDAFDLLVGERVGDERWTQPSG